MAGIFICLGAFAPTWTIPFNRYWVNIYRENGLACPAVFDEVFTVL